MNRSLVAAAIVLLSACTPSPSVTNSGTSSTGSASPTGSVTAVANSVICDAFAQGGPVDDSEQAAIAAIHQENEATATRAAVTKFQALAARASVQAEAADLTAIAHAMDTAALSGEGYTGWSNAFEAFFVKYGNQCGRSAAP